MECFSSALGKLPREELLKLDDLAQERRYESLAEKYGLLDESQYGFVHGMGGTDVPIFITTQLIEHANISKTELRILFMDQHHAFDALEPLTGKLLASMRMGIPTKVAEREILNDQQIKGFHLG
jgi:hypothetical protein